MVASIGKGGVKMDKLELVGVLWTVFITVPLLLLGGLVRREIKRNG